MLANNFESSQLKYDSDNPEKDKRPYQTTKLEKRKKLIDVVETEGLTIK